MNKLHNPNTKTEDRKLSIGVSARVRSVVLVTAAILAFGCGDGRSFASNDQLPYQ